MEYPVDDISKLATTINGVRRHFAYDVDKAADWFSNLELVQSEYATYQMEIEKLKNRSNSNQTVF